jgi:DNA-binding response OmpR family regulator
MVELTAGPRPRIINSGMLRVLMVLEDYGELMFLQTVLKKIGFDVDAIQNPRSFQDSVLRMNPDVLVMTANGKKVKGYELSSGLKRTRGLPHIILIKSGGGSETADARIGGWLTSPVGALDLLNMIGDLCGLNKEVLAEKFGKLRLQEQSSGNEARVLNLDEQSEEEELERSEKPQGNFGVLQQETAEATQARQERYKKVLSQERPDHIGFSVKQVQDQVKSLRKEENKEDLAELERQRKAFVEHLFKKKPV